MREARARFGYGEEDRVLLFVGNEFERKGFDSVLEAVGLMRDPTVKILGAGRVAPDRSLQVADRATGTDRPVQWLGSSSDVALLHAAADVFVLPTRYEPWGLVIVEALGQRAAGRDLAPGRRRARGRVMARTGDSCAIPRILLSSPSSALGARRRAPLGPPRRSPTRCGSTPGRRSSRATSTSCGPWSRNAPHAHVLTIDLTSPAPGDSSRASPRPPRPS